MKIGVIGAGAVGAATVTALIHTCDAAAEIVILDRVGTKAAGLAADTGYAAALVSGATVRAGDYDELAGAQLVIITAGVNEKAGGATDRTDPRGRLVLVPQNAAVYAEIVPSVVAAAPDATLMVVTDPPDPLADLARELAGHDRVVSTGTVIDSLRFRFHLARELGIATPDVDAYVLGEHGTSPPRAATRRRCAPTSNRRCASATSRSSTASAPVSTESGPWSGGWPTRSCPMSTRCCRSPPSAANMA
jgi:L-lactate dehydrogenase